jgi:CheY-like chemotaxis protein
MEKTNCDVQEVILAAIESVRPMADKKTVRIESHLPKETLHIFADCIRLQQIIWNLLTNAIKFSSENGLIEVGLEVVIQDNVKKVQIQVQDEGKGIREDFLPHIFGRFSLADSASTRVHGGLGLGLSIVEKLAHLQDGTVKAENRSGQKGALFTLQFPLLEDGNLSLHELLKQDQRDDKGSDVPDLTNLNILLVDDDELSGEATKIFLESYGAHLTLAHSVQSAVQSLENSKFDIIVSDISMPFEDGYSLMRRVRKLSPHQGQNTPALALTAYATKDDRSRALLAGFQDHFPKPFNAAELGRVIFKICNPQEPKLKS